MVNFDYVNKPSELLTAEIMSLVGNIRERKGRQELFIEAEPQILGSLLEVAKSRVQAHQTALKVYIQAIKGLKSLLKRKQSQKTAPKRKYQDIGMCLQLSMKIMTIYS